MKTSSSIIILILLLLTVTNSIIQQYRIFNLEKENRKLKFLVRFYEAASQSWIYSTNVTFYTNSP